MLAYRLIATILGLCVIAVGVIGVYHLVQTPELIAPIIAGAAAAISMLVLILLVAFRIGDWILYDMTSAIERFFSNRRYERHVGKGPSGP